MFKYIPVNFRKDWSRSGSTKWPDMDTILARPDPLPPTHAKGGGVGIFQKMVFERTDKPDQVC